MTTFPHDLKLGPKPSIEDTNKTLFEYREHPAVLTILHYLRDEAAMSAGDAVVFLREGQQTPSNACTGGFDALTQVLIKLDELRRKAPPVDNSSDNSGDNLHGSPEIEAM